MSETFLLNHCGEEKTTQLSVLATTNYPDEFYIKDQTPNSKGIKLFKSPLNSSHIYLHMSLINSS